MIDLKPIMRCVVGACLLCLIQACAAQSGAPCALPVGLGGEISRRYPGARPVALTDLEEHHRQLFRRDHGSRCPGLVQVNFYGDGKSTWALALISGTGSNPTVELVVARQLPDAWEIRSLEKTNEPAVVWSEGPGTYGGRHGPAIQAKYPVIRFVGYESWGIAYAWTGNQVEKAWTSD